VRPPAQAAWRREGDALHRWTERQWERVSGLYDRGLKWVLDHQRLTLAVTVGTLALTFALAMMIPKGFFPQQDTA